MPYNNHMHLKETPASSPPLEHFHPLVARWFTAHIGVPTDVQQGAWPLIASGEHVLITAPTGSGKTLTGTSAK
jgi:ATP-dependent Lhr-like helicase